MANNLTVASVIDKNRITSSIPWIILLDIEIVDPNTREVTEILRLARNNEMVIFDGEVYQAANFDIRIDQRQGQTPSVSINARDQLGLIQSRMEAMAGGVLSEVQMTVVNTSRMDQPPEMQERFQITSSTAKDAVVTFQLGAENPLGVQFPKHRQQQDRCAWRFKGYGCGYTGGVATCDYTKDGANGCNSKENTVNFRALPGLVRMNI